MSHGGGMSRGGGHESWRGAWCCPAHGQCCRVVGPTEAQLGALPALGPTVAAAGTMPALLGTTVRGRSRGTQPISLLVSWSSCYSLHPPLGYPRPMGSCGRALPCMTWAA